jgi:hypothetical protein
MPYAKIKKPFKRILLEGLHPVYLTLFYVLLSLCHSQRETLAKLNIYHRSQNLKARAI